MTNLKKIAIIIAAALAIGSLTGCGVSKSEFNSLKQRVEALEKMYDSDDLNEIDTTSRSTAKPSSDVDEDTSPFKFNPDTVGDDVEITEYDFIDPDGKKFAFFVFENNSNYDVEAIISIECKNDDGRVLDNEEKTVPGIAAGQSSFASFELDDDTETIVRTVSYRENRGTSLDTIRVRAAKAQGGANVSIANSGNDYADDMKFLTLYFKRDKTDETMVGFDSYDLPELSPGESTTIPSEYYGEYDRVEVYIAFDD